MDASAELTAAAFEFQRYLNDQVAPLMLVEEFGVLLREPPATLAAEAMKWISESGRPADAAAAADLIFHGARKIAQMGEFDLVPRAALGAFLNDYCQEMLAHCPASERPRLIDRIVEYGRTLTAPGAVLEQTQPTPRTGGASAHKMAVFLDQIEAAEPGERRDEVASEFMTTAALEASTSEELHASLAPLRDVGIDPATDNVLQSIAKTLPGWGALLSDDAAGVAPTGERLGAMRQIVALGGDDEEVAKRFREMVHAAISQFNAGNVGRAQSVLVLAQQMAADQRVKPAYVDILRNASDYLDMESLRTASEKAESLPALRTMMSFFHALAPEALVKSLREAGDDNRRHDLSSLIEAHGEAGRARVLEALDAPETQSDPGFAAAALRLLRRIPRPAGAPADREVDTVLKHATRNTDPTVATQAIYVLGQLKGERDERALLGLLRVYEGLLTRPAAIPRGITAEDISSLLDRTCGALARCGTARALRTLVDHGLKTVPELGDCAKRLSEGSHADFSPHPELLARLVTTLRAELPRGVLGMRFKKETGRTVHFVAALSGTPHADVKALFQEVVKKHGDSDFAILAAEALDTFAAREKPEPPVASAFSGDLSFFGLPMLLQTLTQGAMTGLLTLIDTSGHPVSKLWLLEGRLQHASFGRLSNEDALYELLIRPFPGTFAFVHRDDGAEAGALDPPRDLGGMIFEGVRRHDEWKRAAALVADDARLIPSGTDRSIDTDQPQEFVDALWNLAARGSTAQECESSFPVDSYRVRTLLARWVEVDALRLAR